MAHSRIGRAALVACTMVVLAAAAILQAQPKPAAKAPAKAPAKPAPKKPAAPILTGELRNVAKTLNLSVDQQKMIADAVNADRQAYQASQKEYDQKYAELKQRYDKLSGEAKMVYDQMQTLRKERSNRSYAWRGRVSEVLTASQMKKWTEYRLRYYAGSRHQGIELTEEQKQKIDAIYAQAAQEVAKAPDNQKGKAIYNQGYKIRDTISAVITPEQHRKRSLDAIMYTIGYRYRRAELTEEQKATIKQFASEAIKEYQATRQRYNEIQKERDALNKKIYIEPSKLVAEKLVKDILTEEQREKLKSAKE